MFTVTTCTCGRSFSSMWRLKTCTCGAKISERLDEIALTHVYLEILPDIEQEVDLCSDK